MCYSFVSSEERSDVYRFAAVMMGRPVLLNETDISTEYPGDIDDENITEKGFLPALPNELTKISAALALIDATRILTKALDRLYPAAASYSFAVSKAHALSEELEKWCRNLPSHLRLTFCKDKPSTGIISDRSPLLVSIPSENAIAVPNFASHLCTSIFAPSSIDQLSALGQATMPLPRQSQLPILESILCKY